MRPHAYSESEFERYVLSETQPEQYLTLKEVEESGLGVVYWANAHPVFEVVVYAGNHMFVTLHHEQRSSKNINAFRLRNVDHKDDISELSGIKPIVAIDSIEPERLLHGEQLKDYLLRKNYEVLSDKLEWLMSLAAHVEIENDDGYKYVRECTQSNLALLLPYVVKS